MNNDFISLLQNCQSPDKTTRESAESFLLSQASENSNLIISSLLDVVANIDDNSIKLFSLLTMRKLISLYWTEGISFDLKQQVKSAVLAIALVGKDNKNIKNCSRYIIIQICTYEFPEEWTELTDQIFAYMTNVDTVYNGLLLLNEMCEDIITFDIFFDEKYLIYSKVFEFLNSFVTTNYDILNEIIKLFTNSINFYKLIGEINNSYHQKMNEFLVVLNQKIIENFNRKFLITEDFLSCLKTYFDFLQFLILEFKQSLTVDQIKLIIFQGVSYLKWLNDIYQNDKSTYEDNQVFNSLVINIIAYLKIGSKFKKFKALLAEEYEHIVDILISFNIISSDKKESLVDINEIIEDCLDRDMNLNKYEIRDQIEEFFYNDIALQSLLFHKLSSYQEDYENLLTMLTYCIDENSQNIQLLKKNILMKMFAGVEQLDDLIVFRLLYLTSMIKNDSKIIFSAYNAVINLINKNTFIDFSIYWFITKNLDQLSTTIDYNIELKIIKGLQTLIDEVDTEKYHTLIEMILQLSERDFTSWNSNDIKLINFDIFESILKICSIDNNQDLGASAIYEDLEVILQNVLASVDANNSYHLEFCNKYMANLIPLLDTTCTYFTRKLSLMILNSLIKNWYVDEHQFLPIMVINYILDPLVKLINYTLNDTDDSLIDDMVTVLNVIIKKTNDNDIQNFESILNILSNILDLGGHRCEKLGTLTITVVSKLPKRSIAEVLDEIVLKIIKLFISEGNGNNFKILENLNKFICYIFINDVNYVMNLFKNKVSENEVVLFFEKWFDIFESIRGVFSIKCNIISFINTFNYNELNMILVKGPIKSNPLLSGDRVITRSMSKRMTIEYELIPLYQKILTILSNECLMLISNQKESFETVDCENEEDDDDEWEDVGTNVDYTQLNDLLKYSIENEEEYSEEDIPEDEDIIDGVEITKKSNLQVIIVFLKTIAQSHEFETYFKTLSKDQQNDLINALL
ncbi:uncharacterized protein HGUI_01655 [Hanseniaspora guilliermondii]|uniref:Importin N-terminal domain-containing protein n=1 Tax=Hanseniaspora guilliermondii TaxID=56406 RepID=A0A1L0CXA0_9ASCO|nr:uncharacterized protein HGUI_01655 [Hanseniaspora guilliermondii]